MDLNNKLYIKLVLGNFMIDLDNKLYVKTYVGEFYDGTWMINYMLNLHWEIL